MSRTQSGLSHHSSPSPVIKAVGEVMTVSSDIQLWGEGGSARSRATSALINDSLNRGFAESVTGDQVVGQFGQLQVQHVSSGQFESILTASHHIKFV